MVVSTTTSLSSTSVWTTGTRGTWFKDLIKEHGPGRCQKSSSQSKKKHASPYLHPQLHLQLGQGPVRVTLWKRHIIKVHQHAHEQEQRRAVLTASNSSSGLLQPAAIAVVFIRLVPTFATSSTALQALYR